MVRFYINTFLAVCIATLSSLSTANAQTFQGDATLSTQSQVDNFTDGGSLYTGVNGNLTIQGGNTDPIVNLNTLSNLTLVDLDLNIQNMTSANLDAVVMPQLNNVGRFINVTGNTGDFSSVLLPALTRTNRINILNNTSQSTGTNRGIEFRSPRLNLIGGVFIEGNSPNAYLVDITDLAELQAISVQNNNGDVILTAPTLTTVTNFVTVFNNTALTSLNFLSEIETITSDFLIENNSNLTSLDGLVSLTTAGSGRVNISGNRVLKDCCPIFPCQVEVTGQLTISNNAGNCRDLNAVNEDCGIRASCVPQEVALNTQGNASGTFSASSFNDPNVTPNQQCPGGGNVLLSFEENSAVTSLPYNYNCGNLGNNPVTIYYYTQGDRSSQRSCQTTISIVDRAAPTPNVTNLPTINEQCQASPSPPFASDNCFSGTIRGTTNASFPIRTSRTITWTYSDGNNISTQTQRVNINDTEGPSPTVAQLPTITEQCSASPQRPTATDNCVSGTIRGTANTTFPIRSSRTITWTYTDGTNTTTQTQRVNILDTEPPTPRISPLSTINEQCPVTPIAPTATDNCVSGNISATANASFPIRTSQTITWTYMDGTNTTTQTQRININDTQPPVPNVASLPAINEQCSASPNPPTASDNCFTGLINGVTTTQFPITESTTITWSYTDGSNTITQDQSVNISDTQAPTPNVAQLPTITEQCSATPTPPTASDNCLMGIIEGTTSTPFPITESTTITWTYNDGSNTSTQQQTVVIDDTRAPTPGVANLPTVMEQCEASPTAPTATDNCLSTTIEGTTNTPFPITESTTITWMFTDGENQSSQTQEVVIDDTQGPEPDITDLSTVMGQCEAFPSTPTATDNCLSRTINGMTTTPFPITESMTITWFYTDGENQSSQTQEIIIDDNTNPSLTLVGMSTVTLQQGEPYVEQGATPSDNCNFTTSVQVDNDAVNTDEPGTYTVTYDFTDESGNGAAQITREIIVLGPELVFAGDPTFGTDFGEVNSPGTRFSTRTFTLSNIGDGLASGISLTSTNPEFSIVTTIPTTLNTQASITFEVQFDPSGDGIRSGSLLLNTDQQDEATDLATLTGEGIPNRVFLVQTQLFYPTITEAIEAATQPTTIIIPAGEYPENPDFGGKVITIRIGEPDQD